MALTYNLTSTYNAPTELISDIQEFTTLVGVRTLNINLPSGSNITVLSPEHPGNLDRCGYVVHVYDCDFVKRLESATVYSTIALSDYVLSWADHYCNCEYCGYSNVH